MKEDAALTGSHVKESGQAGFQPDLIESEFDKLDRSEQEAVKELVPKVVSLKELEKKGVNTAYLAKDNRGQTFFIKFFTYEERSLFSPANRKALLPNFAPLHEAASSILANYITSGLVPAGKAHGVGVAYPYMALDQNATKSLFKGTYPDYKFEDIYQYINFEQRCQLFVHMISDLVLNNFDTHTGQFAVSKGEILAFDKGRSYLDTIFKETVIREFSLEKEIITNSKVYKNFAEHLSEDKDELKKIISSPLVQNALKKIEALGVGGENEVLFDLMSPLTTYIDYVAESQDNPSLSQIKKSYVGLFKDLKKVLAEWLDISEDLFGYDDESISTKLKYTIEAGVSSISFDPKEFSPVILAPIEEGIPGDKVSNMLKSWGCGRDQWRLF
ncbi:MAG: hypothetical protein HYW48_10790 [Deltaproteobacteria bacterium]|nr:hypothetical protein [Deltaproteobacteria bacterium]